MDQNLVVIRIVIFSILILFNFGAYAQENRQSAIGQERGIAPISSEQNKMLIQTLENLRNSLATDMESFSKVNEGYFLNFNKGNQTALDKVIKQINAQNNRLQDTNSIFKSELIPAIKSEMDKINSRVDILTMDMESSYAMHNEKLLKLIDILKSVVVALQKQENFLESNQKQTLSFLANVDKKNKALIEIIKKDILVDEEIKSLTEASLNTQRKIKDALADLRNKANVNISRNSDILNKLKK